MVSLELWLRRAPKSPGADGFVYHSSAVTVTGAATQHCVACCQDV